MKSKYANVSIQENLSWSEFVFKNVEEYGNTTAIVCGSTKISYTFSQVRDLSRKFGSALSNRGIIKGDVVAILAPNVPEFAIIFLGVLQIGGVVTGVNPHFTCQELTNQLKESNARCIVASHQLAHRVKESSRVLKIDHVFIIGDDDECELVSNLLKEDDSHLPLVTFNPREDLAILPFSIGIGGLPKAVMITHYNLVSFGSLVSAEEFLDFRENSRVFTTAPFYQVFGSIAVLSLCLFRGATLISVPRFEYSKVFHHLQDHKVTHLVTEASTVHAISKHPTVDNHDLTSLTQIISSSSSLSKETSRNVIKRIPRLKRISQCYSMTECTSISHMTSPMDAKDGSVGVLLPNLECKVCDVTTGQTLDRGQCGEICFRGPTVMKGYLKSQEATDLMIDTEGWLHTGDLGYYDRDEHFFIVDKIKDLIKVRGHQVSPSELEVLLRAHPAIEDAAVVGVSDPQIGELPIAYVVSKNDDELTEMEIMQYVDENVAPHKRLRGGVDFISTIPKAVNGEILRAELRELYKRNKSKMQARRGSLPWNEEKRWSSKRHSIVGPSSRAQHRGTVSEEIPRNVARSQSCALL